MAGGQINFKVGYTVDKTGLQAMKASLQEIQNMTANDLMGKGFAGNIQQADAALKLAQQDAQTLSTILTQSFNKDLGTVNIQKFNNALKASNLDLNKVYSSMSAIGTKGISAFRNMSTQIMTSNLQLKKTSNLLDSMATTMGNTIKWGIASSVLNTFTGKAQEAYGYIKSLDGSLNDIRIVTGKSADEMERFADKANKAAKQLGAATKEYTDASLIYYQQGLSDKDTAARAEVTTKVANVTGQNAQEVSEQLTAVWNGYKVSADEAEMYIDKLSAVAATTASDLEELSTGMSKVASAANSMGVNADQLNAQLATIISVTRQAPESVGTALKTIYARMGDLAVDGEDEFGTKLGEVSGKMAQMGIQVVDQQGNLRDMGIVIEETAAKWDTWTEAQKQAAAVAMAGKRQYNNLIALFDNWDMYTQALNTSQNSLGRLQEQQDIYMESTAYHLQSMKTSWEDVYDSMLDEDTINSFADVWGGVGTVIANAIDGLGGGGEALLMLGSILMQVFSKQLASGINNFSTNLKNAEYNAEQFADKLAFVNTLGDLDNLDEGTATIRDLENELLKFRNIMTEEDFNKGQAFIRQTEAIYQEIDALKLAEQEALAYYERITGVALKIEEVNGKTVFKNSQTGAEVSTDIITADMLDFQEDYLSKGGMDTSQISQSLGAIKQLNGEISKLEDEIAKGNLTEAEAAKKKEALASANEKLANTYVESVGPIEDLQSTMLELEESERLLPQQHDELIKANKKLKQSLNGMSIEDAILTADGRKAIRDYILEINRIKKAAQDSGERIRETFDNIKTGKSKESIQNLKHSIMDFDQYLQNFKNTLKIQDVLHTISAFGQLASAINTIKNLGSIWTNEDISTGEKLLQTVTNLGFALPMLANSLGTVSKTLGLTKMVQDAYNASVLDSIGKETLANLTKKQRVMLDSILQKVITQQSLSQEELNLVNTLGIASDLGLTAANGTLTLSFGTLAGAIWTAMAPLLPYIAIIGAVVLAIAGLVAAFKVMEAQSPEAKLQKAKEEAQKAAEAFNRVSQAVQNVNDKIAALQDSYVTIETLTKGTTEWYNAVANANYEVAKLLELFPQLADYIYNEDGILKISQAGYNYIESENNKRLQTANNIQLSKQKEVNQAEIEVLKQYDNDTDMALGGGEFWKPRFEAALQYYQDPRVGDTMFTEAGAKALTDAFFGDLESHRANYVEGAEHYGDEDYNRAVENMQYWLEENEDRIKQIAQYEEQNKKIDDAQLESKFAALGSTRSAEQAREIMGGKGYLDILKTSRDALDGKVTGEKGGGFGNWNDHINYDKDDDEWGMIEDFMKLQGDNVEYVAQRHGDMVLKIDGEEKSFSEDEVKDALAELYSTENLEVELGEKLRENLNKTLSNVDLEGLDTSTLINLDNLHLQLQDALSGIDGVNVDAVFKELSTSAGTSAEDIEAYANKLNSIDWSDPENLREFKAAAVELEEGSLSVDEFNHKLEKMNALGEMKGMGETFTTAAEQLGLSEEDAGYMHEYATNLMEIAEETEGLSDELASNADSAADLAIEVTRMNTGIEALSEGFEEWSSVLKKSSKTSAEYSKAMSQMKKAVSDILDVEADLVSSDFITSHMEDIEKAAQGDANAIDALRADMDEAIIQQITVGQSEDFKQKVLTIENSLKSELDRINTELPDIEVGAIVDDAGFLAAANELVKTAGMTADEANAYFAGIGYEPVYNQTEVDTGATLPNATTKMTVDKVAFDGGELIDLGPLGSINLPSITYTTTSEPQEPIEADASMRLTSFSGDGTPPEIKGLRKKASGSMNNYSSSNSGGKKLGGGGGSKKKAQKSKQKIDPFRTINSKIQQSETELVKLEKEREKLSGGALLKNLAKQAAILEEQKELQAEKLEIAKEEERKIRQEIQTAGEDGFIFDIQFDSEGNITNYDEIAQKELAALKAAEAKFNASAQEDADQEAYDAAVERFEAFEELINQYDEMHDNTISEIEQKIQELRDQIIEMQIEAFTLEVEMKLDIKDAERDWNDFKKNMTIDEDDILGSARFSFNNLGTYLSNDGTIATLTDQSNTLLDQLAQMNATGTSSIYGDNRAALMEDIAENQDALMAAMEEQKDLLDEIEQAYFDMLDAAQEAFDEQVAQYEAINEVYSHGLNVINVLYGEDAYAEMEDFYQSTIENTNDLISFQAKQIQMWKEKLNDPSLTDEQRDEIQKKMQEAQAVVLSSVETQLDNIINKYTNAINKIFKELEDKMTGGKGMSYIQEEWDLLNKNADMYLDQVNSAYEVEKLAREYNKAIDATDSLSAQRKLNELMEEQLKGLREKEKLTQYDVDRANALLDIELKRIALEEAQQNKSKMRLRRDASGNYSYQFVSDEDATAQAQQELADAQNSLYNLDKDAYKENLDTIVQLEQEFTEKYAEVMLDTTLTEEERQAKRLLLEEQYNEMMNNLLAQNTALRINLEDTALQEMSNLNQSYLMEELIPGWNSGVQEMASFMTGEGGLLPTCADSFAELSGVTQQYITDLDTLEAVAGVDLSNVAGYTDAIVNSMTPVLENNDELIDKYNEEIRLMGELQTEAQTLAQTYNGITTAAMAAVDAMLAARKTEADIDAEKAAQEAAAQQQAANEAAAAAQQQAAQQPSLAVGTGVTVKTTATHFSRDGGNGTRMKSFVPGSSYAVMQVSGNEVLIGRGGVATGWVNKTDLVGFRTGGYTGDWADAKGRLAVLHQKELVLNSKDTQNILRAVDVVRQIDGIMSSIMGNAFNKINNQINGLNSMSFPVGGPTSSEAAVAQHIEINADFPGVEKASEIISAFENLTNMATQYAFKTDR